MTTVAFLPGLLSHGQPGWGSAPASLPGLAVTVVSPADNACTQPPYAMRWVATTAEALHRETTAPSLVLVARGAAGVLLPQLSVAVRARGRRVAGYAFIDAWLPRAGATLGDLADVPEAARAEIVPGPTDWPDAPCAYAMTDESFAQQARVARLRAWPVVVSGPARTFNECVGSVIRTLLPQ